MTDDVVLLKQKAPFLMQNIALTHKGRGFGALCASASHQQFPFGTTEVFALVQCSVISLGLRLTQVHHHLHSRSASVGFLLELNHKNGNSLHQLDSKCRTNWDTEKEGSRYAS